MALPLCSSFVPTILEGQRCYKLELKELSGKGKRNELMLLLDNNEERSLQTSSKADEVEESQFSWKKMNFDTAVAGLQGVSAKVQINTLSPFVHFGGGIFSMTDVKKMTTKEDFFKLPLKERGCEADLYEDCRTESLVKECNCVPWELPGFQVGDTHIDFQLLFFSGFGEMQSQRQRLF